MVAAGGIAGFPAVVRAQSRTLVTTGYGGLHERHFRPAVIEPFEKLTGAKVEIKYGAPGWLPSAIVNRNNPEIDVAFLPLPIAMKAIQTRGVFLDLTPELIPNLAEIPPIFYDEYDRKAVGFNYAAYGIGYRTDIVKPAPVSWAELWNPAYAGKVVLPDITAGYFHESIILTSLANGGSQTDLDLAFDVLKKLKPALLRIYKTSAEPVPLFQRGECVIGGFGSGRTYETKDTGAAVDFVSPKEGAPVGVLSFHVARNTRKRDLALQYVNYALSREAQEAFCNAIEYGPCNRTAELRGRALERVPPLDKLLRIEWSLVNPLMQVMEERWLKEIAS